MDDSVSRKADKSKGRSPFAGHRRRGRRHLPPLLDLPVEPTMRPFRKVAFPDFLWLLTMLRNRPLKDGPGTVATALDLGQGAFRRAFERGSLGVNTEPVFHGLLTDWERIPDVERAEALRDLEAHGLYEMIAPESLAHALAFYEKAPGMWLFQPRLDRGLVPDKSKAEEELWETMRLGGDSHEQLASDAIYLWLRGLVRMRRLRFSANDPAFALLRRYEEELSEGERKAAESVLHASFLSIGAATADASENRPSEEWCERFWRANWGLFPCIVGASDDEEPASDEARSAGLARIYRLHYRFLRASQEIDPDTWDHDRYDVAMGITWRILRTAAYVIGTSSLWSEEHGYPAIRSLFDSYVQLKWMLAVESGRPGVWREFKNYGRGRNKALLLHTKEVMSRVEGEPREILEGLVPKLEADANRENPIDFQDITTANTFAGDKSLLEMATDVGLADMYHSVMIPASSALHGDWSALTEYVLDRCRHALHDGHFIPRARYADEATEQFPLLAESFADWVFQDFCRAMRKVPLTNKEAEAEMGVGAHRPEQSDDD